MNALNMLAVMIEFGGALVIVAHVAGAAWLALRHSGAGAASVIAARGLVAGLDFKLAATLLKTIILVSWNQLATFAAVLALRVFVKRTLTLSARLTGSKAN